MQHCVITDVPLGQMRRDPFAPRGLTALTHFYRPDEYGLDSRDKVDFLRYRGLAHLRVHCGEKQLASQRRGRISERLPMDGWQIAPRTWYGCLKPNEVEYMAISLRYAFERI